MEILKPDQIRDWELYTMKVQGIDSINLMEKAAQSVVQWLEGSIYSQSTFYIFCGKGNNGGDGLAIARLLYELGKPTIVYILENGHKGSDAFQFQLQLLRKTTVEVHFYSEAHPINLNKSEAIIIDALFGIGLNKPLEDLGAYLVQQLNQSPIPKISIDIPSGIFSNQSSKGYSYINASITLTFQCLKPAFLFQENADGFGIVYVLNIDLEKSYLKSLSTDYQIIDNQYLKLIFSKRKLFSHKGNHGHALIIAGSTGMMGAAVLAASGCMRSGIGKLTVLVPTNGVNILQISLPEAICKTADEVNHAIEDLDLNNYQSIGLGPGIGIQESHQKVIEYLFTNYKGKLLLDADALNFLAKNQQLLKSIPSHSIITPHPKELERLFGKVKNDFERLQLIQQKAKELNIYIILKGKYTFIATPDAKVYVSSFGNPGLAKAGSGDVLSGIITSFLGQGYDPLHAACLGVSLHGIAADIALESQSVESLLASDLCKNIGKAFLTL